MNGSGITHWRTYLSYVVHNLCLRLMFRHMLPTRLNVLAYLTNSAILCSFINSLVSYKEIFQLKEKKICYRRDVLSYTMILFKIFTHTQSLSIKRPSGVERRQGSINLHVKYGVYALTKRRTICHGKVISSFIDTQRVYLVEVFETLVYGNITTHFTKCWRQ